MASSLKKKMCSSAKGFTLIQDRTTPFRASESLNYSVRLDPNYAVAWNNKGEILKALGRTNEADVAYAKAKELGYGG
jgi:Flp pilus assembly protein TadD